MTQLWIGVEGTGLYKMDIQSQHFTHFPEGTRAGQINSDLVRDIIRDRDGRLFIATDGGGLNIYDDDTRTVSAIQI
jgi:ligand-binding sensor domain-containing protein